MYAMNYSTDTEVSVSAPEIAEGFVPGGTKPERLNSFRPLLQRRRYLRSLLDLFQRYPIELQRRQTSQKKNSGNIKSEEEWAERAAAFLKHKLKETETTYAELAKRLRKHGLKETEASITNVCAIIPLHPTFLSLSICASCESG